MPHIVGILSSYLSVDVIAQAFYPELYKTLASYIVPSTIFFENSPARRLLGSTISEA